LCRVSAAAAAIAAISGSVRLGCRDVLEEGNEASPKNLSDGGRHLLVVARVVEEPGDDALQRLPSKNGRPSRREGVNRLDDPPELAIAVVRRDGVPPLLPQEGEVGAGRVLVEGLEERLGFRV
jgi:hypothetical protein